MDIGGNDICMSPFSGLTIGPMGDIQLCCMASWYSLGKLQEVDDLEEFYNSSPQLVEIRRLFSTGQYGKFEPCTKACYHKEMAGDTGIVKVIQETDAYKLDFFKEDFEKIACGKKVPIRFLEVTTSNQCQASCTMCSSQFSSKWAEIEEDNNSSARWRYFRGGKNHGLLRIDDPEIEKIVKVIPELTHFSLKGGEPFADIRNIYLLEKFAELNKNNAQIYITTNAGILTDEEFNIIESVVKKGCDMKIVCSIDNVGSLYEYIRSIPFERSIQNVKRLYSIGCNVQIYMTYSTWNWFNFGDFLEYMVEDKAWEWLDWISAFNVVWNGPVESDPRILSEELYQEGKRKTLAAVEKYGKILWDNACFNPNDTINAMESKLYKANTKTEEMLVGQHWIFKEYVDRMSDNRMHDILELVPELKDYYFNGRNIDEDAEIVLSNDNILYFENGVAKEKPASWKV